MKRLAAFILVLLMMLANSLATAAGIESGYLEAEGFAPPQEGSNMGVLRRIAIVNAYRNLALLADEVFVSSGVTVTQLKESDETIKIKLDAIINGVKVVAVTGNANEGVTATVRLPVYGGKKSLASVVLPENVQVQDFPPLTSKRIITRKYTGLIVDCRGQDLSTAIIPAIKSVDGTEFYSYKNIGYDVAVSNGPVAYSTGMDSGVERAGNFPLVVKAVGVSGKCDVVVSKMSMWRILLANRSTHFLNDCAVVFVR